MQPLTATERKQLSDLLQFAQQTLINTADLLRVRNPKAFAIDSLLAKAGQAADLRKRVEQ